MAPAEILLLPPELRELRSYCPDGQVKQRALAGPITLSAPTVRAQKNSLRFRIAKHAGFTQVYKQGLQHIMAVDWKKHADLFWATR